MSTTAERFTGPCTFHGEGPFWVANDRLLLVDMLAGAVVAVDGDGGQPDAGAVFRSEAGVRGAPVLAFAG